MLPPNNLNNRKLEPKMQIRVILWWCAVVIAYVIYYKILLLMVFMQIAFKSLASRFQLLHARAHTYIDNRGKNDKEKNEKSELNLLLPPQQTEINKN